MLQNYSFRENKIKLFCIPYAGASASVYYKWSKFLHNSIELVPIELKGRGSRIHESLYSSIDNAAEDIFYQIKMEIAHNRYAIFGHSMGGVISYELMRMIRNEKMPLPDQIFFSGCIPPENRVIDKIANISDVNELKKQILKIGGTPNEIFESEYLSNIFVPILRADIKMLQEYQFTKNDTPFPCNISIFHGVYDKTINSNLLFDWEKYTSKDCRIFNFKGDHFFVNNCAEDVVRTIE